MKVLVTGSGGILGQRVLAALPRLIPDVQVVRFQGDLTDTDTVTRNFTQSDPYDAIMHLAAMVSVPEVQADPAQAYAVNVAGTINLLRESQKDGARPYFLYASSAHIYDQSDDPIGEDAPKNPLTLYGKTKWLGEQIAAQMCELAEQPFCAARMFSLWDENQKPPYLYGAIKKRLSEENLDDPFFVYSAASLRDFSSASELADMMVQLLVHRVIGPINIGSGQGTQIRDFVQSISPKPLNIVTEPSKTTLIADISRLKQVLS